MPDDFKRARQGQCPYCRAPAGIDCPDTTRTNGQARAALKVSEADMRAFAEEWREEFLWLSEN